jgi:tetratricopeptide (TPR) repeat protein
MMYVHLYRGDEPAAVNQARKNLADFPSSGSPLMLLRNHELRAGRYAEARALYEKFHPELLSDDDPQVGRTNRGGAVDLALVLFKTGETERAERILNRGLQYINTQSRFPAPYVAQIFALQGKKQNALSVLRQGIDEGWRNWWWYVFKHEPNLESLHEEPEFKSMVAEIEADMAAQLARVREMERNGELEPIPELAAE